MENLTQFIEKLDKLTFSTVDRDKLELTSEEGFTVKLMLEISTIRVKASYPIQVVVRVIKEGVIVLMMTIKKQFFGCIRKATN